MTASDKMITRPIKIFHQERFLICFLMSYLSETHLQLYIGILLLHEYQIQNTTKNFSDYLNFKNTETIMPILKELITSLHDLLKSKNFPNSEIICGIVIFVGFVSLSLKSNICERKLSSQLKNSLFFRSISKNFN